MQKFILYLLYYDFYYYFTHRLLHSRVLYPIHKFHHKSRITQYYDFYTVHIVEVPLTSIGLFIAIYIHHLYIYQFILCVIFINIRGMMCHEHKYAHIIGDHHLLHHKYYKCNYGEYWLDYIFGTLRDKKSELLRIR